MSDLDPEARALLGAARAARPTAEARARIDAGLQTELGLPALSPPTRTASCSSAQPVAAQPAAPPPPLRVVRARNTPLARVVTTGVLVGALAAATAAVVWLRPSPAPSAARIGPSVEAGAQTSAAPLPVEPSGPAAATPTVDPKSAEPPTRATRRHGPRSAPTSATSLDEELVLMRSAQQALKRGDGATALAELDALAAKHPDGVLREERLAARVLALCAAGRVDEARAAGRRFLDEMPGSVQGDRVRASCAFASPGAPAP